MYIKLALISRLSSRWRRTNYPLAFSALFTTEWQHNVDDVWEFAKAFAHLVNLVVQLLLPLCVDLLLFWGSKTQVVPVSGLNLHRHRALRVESGD